jgi:PiT family inorganic phosphate transporter
VGIDMVNLKPYHGFAADTAAAACLLLSSVTGIPVSTTHTKTTAIMGVGASKRLSAVNWSLVRDMVLTWVLTFPGCGLLGYLTAKLFIAIF